MKFQAIIGIITTTILFSAMHQTSAECNTTSCGAHEECKFYQCVLGVECVCVDGYKLYPLTGECVQATRKVGENCSSSATCMGENTQCENYNETTSTYKVCRCSSGYTVNSATTDCSAITLGGACTSSGCGKYAKCVDKVCKCMPGYKASGDGTNCTHLLPGDACSSKTECQKEDCHGGTCTTGYYECLNGLKWYISLYTKTASSDIVLKHGSCVPARSITDIGGGQYCGTTDSQQYFFCSSGLTCALCPEDVANRDRLICRGNGASMTSFSYLAVVCTLLLSIYFH